MMYLYFPKGNESEIICKGVVNMNSMNNQKKFLRSIDNTLCVQSKFGLPIPIISDIIDVRTTNNKVVFVDFADGTTEKAVLDKEDTFSLEQGISICITKKLFSDRCGSGSSTYNKIIQKAVKVFERKNKRLDEEIKQQQAEQEKFDKLKKKREAKRIKRENAERERQIEIQKEAYLRAMREYNSAETKAE